MEALEYITIFLTGVVGLIGSFTNLKNDANNPTGWGWACIGFVALGTLGSILCNWYNTEEATKRHQEIVNNLTGGDGYTTIVLRIEDDIAYPVISMVGEYPMHDVWIDLIDATRYPEGHPRHGVDFNRHNTIQVGKLHPGRAGDWNGRVKLDMSCCDSAAYTFDTYSNNNHTWQDFKLQKQGDNWVKAWRLVDFEDNYIIKDSIEPGFIVKGDSIRW